MRIRRLCPPVLITLLALPTPAVPQATTDQAVIQAGTHVVLVNVVAKDKRGKPVDGLTRDDFVLRDNGQEQKIGLFARKRPACRQPRFRVRRPSLTFTNRPAPNSPA